VLLGITVTAANAGASVLVQNEGELEFSGWSWLPGQPIYLGTVAQVTLVPTVSSLANQVADGGVATNYNVYNAALENERALMARI